MIQISKLKIETSSDKGKQCPRCGSTNTDRQNGIWYCYDCQKEGF